MKKNLLGKFTLFLFTANIGFSQSSCIDADMNFANVSQFKSNSSWSASHGSPTVSSNSAWTWSHSDRGEGLNYETYSFLKGHQYQITIDANTTTKNNAKANRRAFFRLIATPDPVIGRVSNSNGAVIPAIPATSQVIATQKWNVTNPPARKNYVYTFTARRNFSNLWIYPSTPTLPQIELNVRALNICDISCTNANMSFESESAFKSNTNWSASHGSPTVSSNYAWSWSYNNTGEGLNYKSYKFLKGQKYQIKFTASTTIKDATIADANAYFRVVATPNQVNGQVTSAGGGRIPTIPLGSQIIATRNFNSTNPPAINVFTYTFTATDNFSNLWFYPASSSLPQIEFAIRTLEICRIDNFVISKNSMKKSKVFYETPDVVVEESEFFRNNESLNSGVSNTYIYNLLSGILVKTVSSEYQNNDVDYSDLNQGLYIVKTVGANGEVSERKIQINN